MPIDPTDLAKASAPWAAWTQSGAWPRRHTQGRADPLAHQDLGELLPVRLQLDVPDGGRQPLAERHRTRPLGQALLPVLDRLGVWSDALAQRSCPSASTSISQAYQPRTAAWPSRRSAAGVELDGGVIGTLDIYAGKPRGWDPSEVAALQAYAGLVASLLSAAVTAEVKGRLAGQLQAALEYRWLIEQAMGVLMAASGWMPRRPLSGCGGRPGIRPGGWLMWPGT
jgi:hypothetical protein